jgi:hypothetical protein
MTKLATLVVSAALLSGCATIFYGDPKMKGGAYQCRAECGRQALEFAGYVTMGEYSDGCICVPKEAPSAHSSNVRVNIGPAVVAAMTAKQQHDGNIAAALLVIVAIPDAFL